MDAAQRMTVCQTTGAQAVSEIEVLTSLLWPLLVTCHCINCYCYDVMMVVSEQTIKYFCNKSKAV